MAKLRELIIKISANSSSYQSEIAKAARLGENYHRVMEGGNRRAAAAARSSSAALRDLNHQLVSVKASAMGLTGAFAGIFATSKLVETADKWTNLNSRLKLATQSSLDLAESQRMLMAMSQKTGTSFEANATVFARAATPMRALGYATKEIVGMTETLSAGLRVSGASASEASSVLIQFSQAMSSGVLRGEEFNAMAENGGRILQALADGLGVSRTKMKAMADGGLLTMDKVIPALLSQLGKLRAESESMGATVEKSLTRVQNSFMEWVGDVNKATGTTRVLAGTLDDLSKNINNVAAAGMVVAGLFGAKAIGNRLTAIQASTSALIQNSRAEINNADQAYRNAQVQVANARATELQAQRNVLAARSRLLQTTNDQQFTAAQLRLNRAIEAEAKAHAVVTQSIAARTAAQSRLNAVTSLGQRMGGALLGAVGGIPGALILAAGAAYLLYQNQKQAKEEAREHAKEAANIRKELSKMDPIQLRINKEKLTEDLAVAKQDLESFREEMAINRSRLITFMKNQSQGKNVDDKVTEFSTKLSESQSAYEATKKTIDEITATLASLGEQQSINSEKAKKFTAAINEIRKTGNVMQALQNQELKLTVSLLEQIKSLGIDVSGIRIPVPEVKFEPNDKLKALLADQEREIDLSRRKGLDKAQREAHYKAIDAGLNPNDRQQKPYVDRMVNNATQIYQNTEAMRKQDEAAREARNAAERATQKAARAAEDYAQKVAELNTQLATEAVRYQEGNTAAERFAAAQGNVTKFTQAQNTQLNLLNQKLEEAKQRYQDLQAAIEADPFRHVAKRTQEATEQLQRQQANGQIESPAEYTYRKSEIWKDDVRGKAEASQQYAVSAKNDLLGDVDPIQDIENQLERKKALYQTYADAEVISQQRKGERILAAERDTDSKRIEAAKQVFASQGELQSLAITMFETTQERMGNMVTGLLTGSKSLREGMSELFASLAQDVVKSLVKMAAQALITNTIMKGMGSMGGGGMFSGFASMFTQNAKGGVYTSANLSQYSGQIVNSPTLFAFAKGAGLMGEAGPEAIMPLKRGADGSLGVRAVFPAGNMGGAPNIQIYITEGKAESTSSKGENEAFGRRFAQAVAQVYYTERDRDLRQGGAINKAIRGR
ncbi:tape measure protein [Xenorhabdus sp. KK7.4]|uniref:tape measure protein n=1 Tax=Xenorhabdus sp. KK7.4 TaxID=1851572 RepID=UPI000C050124|nr:tape measure protein [Xenorhabdus sp. KK7.4]PHM51015.1 tail fiber protein [Xenorhabdus sp. KK7.4]